MPGMPSSNLVRILAFGFLAVWTGDLAMAAEPATPPHVDHILLGASDLDRAVEAVAKATGVQPVYGGKHPSGTHNALLSLGGRTYLEVIAPQPGVKGPTRYGDFEKLAKPTPIGWAVSGGDLASLRQRLETAGFPLTPAAPGSRVTPAGTTLHWQTFGLATEIPQAPFFIVWSAETPHPSTTSPSGCTLKELVLAGPDAARLEKLRAALGLTVRVVQGTSAAMTLKLQCPRGPVVFGGS
jgi:Glyoxalase-like domain